MATIPSAEAAERCQVCGVPGGAGHAHTFKYADEVIEDLQDSIQREAFVDPVVTPCRHTFSRSSILPWLQRSTTCPTCRKPCSIAQVKDESFTLTSILGQLKVFCPIELEKGVHVTFPRDAMPAHLRTCPKREVLCSICASAMCADELVSHGDSCPKAPVVCPNGCNTRLLREQLGPHIAICSRPCSNGCGLKVVVVDTQKHLDVCPNALVQCHASYDGVACTAVVRRADMSRHHLQCELNSQPCPQCSLPVRLRDSEKHSCVQILASKCASLVQQNATISAHLKYLEQFLAPMMGCMGEDRWRGSCVRELSLEHAESVSRVAISDKGTYIAACGKDTTIRVWAFHTGKQILLEPANPRRRQPIRRLAISPDEQHVAASTPDHVRVWRAGTGRLVFELLGEAFAFSPDGQRMVIISDPEMVVCNMRDGAIHKTLAESHKTSCTAMHPANDQLVSGSWEDPLVRVWSIERGACVRVLRGHTHIVSCIAYTPDGSRAVSGSWDQTARVWDPVSGSCLFTLLGHTDTLRALAISRDGRRLLSGADGNVVRVWSMDAGVLVSEHRGIEGDLRAAVLTPDGSCLVASPAPGEPGPQGEGTAVIQAGPGMRVVHRVGPNAACLAMEASGRYLATGLAGGAVCVWGP